MITRFLDWLFPLTKAAPAQRCAGERHWYCADGQRTLAGTVYICILCDAENLVPSRR